MSEKITLEQFQEKMKPIEDEVSKLNRRLNELRAEFQALANSVEPVDGYEKDKFADTMFECASYFIDSIDYEHSTVEPGNVDIWQASSVC